MKVRYSFSSHRTRNVKNIRKQRPKYPALADKVVEEADIILEVLDARFIEETRNLQIEETIARKNKKIIYVLNKADLIDTKKIPKETLDKVTPFVFVSSKDREGINKLRTKIKIEAKKVPKKEKKFEDGSFEDRIKVGVLGYPNTGKSSLINVLTGKSSAGVGSDAGFTRGVQKIKLSSNIILIDSPGVIPQSEYHHSETEKIAQHTKLNARAYSQVRNPENVILLIMRDYPQLLEKYYEIPANGDVDFFLDELGKKKGFMKKGGETNTDMVARSVIKDWQTGKIRM